MPSKETHDEETDVSISDTLVESVKQPSSSPTKRKRHRLHKSGGRESPPDCYYCQGWNFDQENKIKQRI